MSHPKRRGLHSDVSPARMRFLVWAAILVVLAASVLQAAIAGATAGVGSFRVACAPSHDGVFDPIVFPGQLPAGHQHEFYGSTETGPSSAPGSVIASPTTCSDSADSSGYWHPTVFFDGARARASLASIYYTQRTTSKPVADLQSWPAGLRVIAGDGQAQSPQNTFIVWWDCDGVDLDHQPTAPTCPTNSRGLEVNVRFPDCWDGANLDSADHKSHMSYSVNTGGVFRCDAAHPVALPYLHMIFRWDGQFPSGESVTLSSGSTLTFHADFMNGWNQERLESLIGQCIKTQTECGKISDGSQPSVAVSTTSPPTTVATANPVATTVTTTYLSNSSATTAATTGHHHTTTTAVASSPSTTVVGTVATGAPAMMAPVTPSQPSGATAIASGPGKQVISADEGPGNNIGAVAMALGVVVLGGGLWALGSWGYHRLRRPPASPRL